MGMPIQAMIPTFTTVSTMMSTKMPRMIRSKRAAFRRIVPHVRHAHKKRLVDQLHGEQDALRREIERIEIELVVVGERAFHHELRHVIDDRIEEERHEERCAILEELPDRGCTP